MCSCSSIINSRNVFSLDLGELVAGADLRSSGHLFREIKGCVSMFSLNPQNSKQSSPRRLERSGGN